MKKLQQLLIRQALILPLLALLEILAGTLTPGYNSVSQHLSELGTGTSSVAAYVNGSGLAIGVSVCLFALGLQSMAGMRGLSPLLLLTFGISMLSNGLFPMGSPLHGLYGIGMVVTIAPLMLAVEFRQRVMAPRYEQYSLLTTAASFLYLWLLVTGVDPDTYAGLTQRIASLVTYSWFAVTAWTLSHRTHSALPSARFA